MTLKQSGHEITGTAGPTPETQRDIRNGQLTADKLTFELPDSTGNVAVELKVGDGALVGKAEFHREYGVITMKLSLKRE